MTYDCIVVGAGFAGVSAARILARRNYRVLLLEARDRIGGRAFTLPISTRLGFPVELGCMAIHGYDWGNPVRTLCEQLSLSTTPAPSGSPELYVADKGPVDSDLAKKLRDCLLKSTPTNSTAAADTLSDAEEQQMYAALARMSEYGPGIPSSDIASKWMTYSAGVAYSSGRDGFVQGGYGRLLQALLDDAGSGLDTRLASEVISFNKRDTAVEVSTKDGQIFKARTALCTMPIGVLKSALHKNSSFFSPPLPHSSLDALSRISVGNLEKVALIYDKPWWPSEPAAFQILHLKKQVPLLVIPIGPRSGAAKAGLLVLVHFSLLTDDLRSPQHLHETIARTLVPHLNTIPQPSETFSSDWATDPFSLGAATSPCTLSTSSTPLDFTTFSRPPVNWEGTLGFAGEGVECFHRGSVPGAIISGEREGTRIAAFLDAQRSLL
ncbi:hypothetical protein DL96DRAFT_1454869 [Flagelloscypha sp. PMI_526]|nr:hypothetical protein DL96DRAFT_1454869 [Flagelloscypha sp. PMI_526]